LIYALLGLLEKLFNVCAHVGTDFHSEVIMVRFLILSLILVGCSSVPSGSRAIESYNKEQELRFSPTRARFTDRGNGVTAHEFGVWAGEAGDSIAQGDLRKDILTAFATNCGFSASDLKEIRIVKHEQSMWYEVWIFNDPASKRPDKTSGMSVVMKPDIASDRTGVGFFGSCK
jgi:hypothetical protein